MSEPGRSPKRLAIILTAAAIAVSLIVWQLLPSSKPAPQRSGPPPVPVSVERVRAEDVAQISRSMGTVQSLHEVVVRTQVAGVLVEVLFKEGQMVKRDQLLARIDDRMIAADVLSARAEKKKTEAQLASARIDLVRYTNLFKQEAVAKQVVDQQAALVEQLESTVAANDAAIAVAETRLSYTRIVSPVDGRVGLRRIDAGNVVQPSDPQGLTTVAQLDPIAVIFSLSQDLLPLLQPLMQSDSPAPVAALDRPTSAALARGHLLVIDNEVDRATGTVELKAEMANHDQKLWPGQTVTVELQTGFHANATVVSPKAVQRGLKGTFVYVVRDEKAEVVPVRVGYEENDRVLILDGVQPGDVIIVDGQSRVVAGAKVKIVEESGKASSPVAREATR